MVFLAEEQTHCIFEICTTGFKEETAFVDGINENSNHFVAFSYLFDLVDKPLTGKLKKESH